MAFEPLPVRVSREAPAAGGWEPTAGLGFYAEDGREAGVSTEKEGFEPSKED